jgi:NAD(P) transhydrogenase subunit alpha
VLFSFLVPGVCGALLQTCTVRLVTWFSLNLLPRTTRAQIMDSLSSMSTIAGYMAVLLAAVALPMFLPMLVTAAGTIVPTKALILGVGVAGLQAIATARRLGAVVSAFDVRRATKEQVESLGAKFLEVELSGGGEGAGGYAKELSAEDKKRTEELVAKNVGEADIVITTAQVPGKKAPRLISADTVKKMRSGAVIVDLAAEQGGNCELTKAGETVEINGVQILGPVNIFATMPVHASQMYGRNICAFVQNIIKDGALNLDFEDEITAGSCATHAGELKLKTP